MLRTPRGAVLGALLTAALAVGLLQAPGQAASQTAPQADRHQARPAYKNSHLPTAQRVADLLSQMTLAEKVGQMTQAERADVTADPSDITTYGLGSVLSGGGSTPAENTPEAWADMVDTFQAAALDTRLGIPLLYGVDSVHGHGNLLGATVFPHNIGLGASRDPKLVEKIEHITAEETRASGPQWVFAPCICVARDDRWGRTYESFGETPSLVESMETAIDGFQGRRGQLDHADRVLATAKHFAGDGLTSYDESMALRTDTYPIDQGVDRVTRAEFDRLALAPYWPAVRRHHVGSVMPSFSSTDFNGGSTDDAVKMHANHELITDVLKGDMGFDGFVITDWQGIRQIPGATTPTQVAARRSTPASTCSWSPTPAATPGSVEFTETLIGLVENGDRLDEPDRRRGLADPDRQVRARPLRAPVHRPAQHGPDRQQGAPQGRPAGGGRVAGAAQEPAAHPAAQRREVEAGVRRGQQRRPHRQAGRRLDDHLAGRPQPGDPGRHHPRRHRGRLEGTCHLQRDR